MKKQTKTILKKGTKVTLLKSSPDPWFIPDHVIGDIESQKDIEFELGEVYKTIIDYNTVSCYYRYPEPFPKYNGRKIDYIYWVCATTSTQKRTVVLNFIWHDILNLDLGMWFWRTFYRLEEWVVDKYDTLTFTSKLK